MNFLTPRHSFSCWAFVYAAMRWYINKRNVYNKDSELGVNCCLIGRVLLRLSRSRVSKYKIVFWSATSERVDTRFIRDSLIKMATHSLTRMHNASHLTSLVHRVCILYDNNKCRCYSICRCARELINGNLHTPRVGSASVDVVCCVFASRAAAAAWNETEYYYYGGEQRG